MADSIDFREQARIAGFARPECVTVVGTGAFGSWVAYLAALAGVPRLVLINPGSSDRNDPANVQGRELGCFPYLPADAGAPKVEALKKAILAVRPAAMVVTHAVAWNAKEHAQLLEGTVFAGASSTECIKEVWATCERRKLRCFGGSYNANSVGVYDHLPGSFRIDPSAPAWTVTSALSASLALQAAFVKPFSYFGNLAETLAMAAPKLESVCRDDMSNC